MSNGPYTCCRCTQPTDNDDDWCDDCAMESREPRCTCLRRDIRHCDSPYDTPPIIRRDPSCEVHGRDPDRERDARIDGQLTGAE